MILVLLILAALIFFPAIIFLDYHKAWDVHKAFWYLFFFIACFFLLRVLINGLGLDLVYYLFIIPIILFGGLALKKFLKRK